MSKYAVVFERSKTGYGAYVPDLPGCIAVAGSKYELERLIAEAISLHIESLQKHGDPVPLPSSEVHYIQPVALARSLASKLACSAISEPKDE